MVIYQAQSRELYKSDDLKLSSRQLADHLVDLFICGVKASGRGGGRT
jgi:hypothetical protein